MKTIYSDAYQSAESYELYLSRMRVEEATDKYLYWRGRAVEAHDSAMKFCNGLIIALVLYIFILFMRIVNGSGV